MRVICEVEESTEENDNGHEVPCMFATCSRCGHQESSFGTSSASERRCLVMLRENCPKGENNFYVSE